jgi:hypothetical protein
VQEGKVMQLLVLRFRELCSACVSPLLYIYGVKGAVYILITRIRNACIRCKLNEVRGTWPAVSSGIIETVRVSYAGIRKRKGGGPKTKKKGSMGA